VRITAVRLDRMRLPLDPPFYAAWDPVPRRHFDATLVTVHTDEGVTGYGSGDTMDGFEPFEPLFTGRDPLAIAGHVRTLESIGFHAGRPDQGGGRRDGQDPGRAAGRPGGRRG
jgi:D-galactarolactone cycloisomerase